MCQMHPLLTLFPGCAVEAAYAGILTQLHEAADAVSAPIADLSRALSSQFKVTQ